MPEMKFLTNTGIKTGDVLDSAQAGQIFEGLYVEAILNPDDVDTSVDKVITRLEEQARDTGISDEIAEEHGRTIYDELASLIT
jgi:hypothetical protein